MSVLLWNDVLYEELVFTGTQVIASKIFSELKLTASQILATGNGKAEEHH